MSNCYLCDSCSYRTYDISVNTCICKHKGEIKKVVWADGDERAPRQICDIYKSNVASALHKAFEGAAALYNDPRN